MSLARAQERLQLPETLRVQLGDFRRRVWTTKLAESSFAAAFGVLAAFGLLFALDRVCETPRGVRGLLFAAAAVGCALIPLALYRWVWRYRRLEPLARLLSRTDPHVGDQLLGVIELVQNDFEQSRSRTLCEAAIRQVAEESRTRDFGRSVSTRRRTTWGILAAFPLVLALGLAIAYPGASGNAWARLIAPWGGPARFTFTSLRPLPGRLVVPLGEPFLVRAELDARTLRRPRVGRAAIDGQRPVSAPGRDAHYDFQLPAQLEPAWVTLQVGDATHRLRIEPTLRPELTGVAADVVLPSYLGLPASRRKDVRGGAITLVNGSLATFSATASRDLAAAEVDGVPRAPVGPTISAPEAAIQDTRTVEFRWRDRDGLAGKAPFRLNVQGQDDEAPSLSVEDLPRQKVVLDTEQLRFQVKGQDDFGVKRLGLEWRGLPDPLVKTPANGERILAAGGHAKESIEATGTFSAHALGIAPQPVQVRAFVEDYLPGRPRVYGPPSILYVLNAEQHAIWLTGQLSKWHRKSLEVRDRELQLHETNKQLRALAREDLDRPVTRRKIEDQAAAERTNGRRLSGLVDTGEDLVRQAMRNPEFGVGHLEKWSEMLNLLKDISRQRMPVVADLLKKAADAPAPPSGTAPTSGPLAGQVRSSTPGARPAAGPPGAPKPPVPQVVDRESSHGSLPKPKGEPPPPSKGQSNPRLLLPQTTLAGGRSSSQPAPPAKETVEEAVVQQRDLLAEFDKIADELNRVLANLEGSTLLKRLKAESRRQDVLAGQIGDQVQEAFGRPAGAPSAAANTAFATIASQEDAAGQSVSRIMDDLDAYFERRRMAKFKAVLDQMKAQDVLGSLRQIGDDVKREAGMTLAQCEYWSDTLDRWAEDLVDSSTCGACPGSKSKDSLPPSVVLEVLQVLEAEVNLREETRVAQQARPALVAEAFGKQAHGLSRTQEGLHLQIVNVTRRIEDLPDGPAQFGPEIGLLGQVSTVMEEAVAILDRPETGSPAIAAETEAIELLLRSKRINPKGGGGGGATPGGGGTGTTTDSAMALIGGGHNPQEVREDRGVSQSTGESGPALPEEFRAGLDEYFNRIERGPNGQ